MEEITRQVTKAQRRMLLDQFLRVLAWTLFFTLLIAFLALAAPKLLVLPVDGQIWMWSWLGGAVAAGLALSAILTWMHRRGSIDAAIEIDRRFGLKERVASALALSDDERDSEPGQALLQDTARRVERIDVKEQFGLTIAWRALLPIIPAILAFAVTLFDDRVNQEAEAARAAKQLEKQQVKKVTQKLKNDLAKKKKEIAEGDLKKLDAIMKKFEKAVDDLESKKDANKKDAMIKLNDVAKDLAKRRDALGGLDKMKKQLQRMKDMEKGPADKMVDALKQGDFKKAMDEVRKMQQQLQKGQLTPQQKKQLANQMQQMQKKIQQMQQAQQQAKQQLKQQIAQKLKQGDRAGAGKLQRQLDKMNAQNQQMQQMQQMANQMQKAAQNLQNGNQQQAAQDLQKMAQNLQQMQQQMNELKTVNQFMDQIADAKNMMQGMNGNQMQDQMGQNMGMGSNFENDKKGGQGLGAGRGEGLRPEEKGDTKTYESQVGQNVRPGEAVRTGSADGANLPGVSRESIKEAVLAEYSEQAEPIENQPLPKFQRKHSNEYFERLRDR